MGRAAAKLQKARNVLQDANEQDSKLFTRVLELLCCARLQLVEEKRPLPDNWCALQATPTLPLTHDSQVGCKSMGGHKSCSRHRECRPDTPFEFLLQ